MHSVEHKLTIVYPRNIHSHAKVRLIRSLDYLSRKHRRFAKHNDAPTAYFIAMPCARPAAETSGFSRSPPGFGNWSMAEAANFINAMLSAEPFQRLAGERDDAIDPLGRIASSRDWMVCEATALARVDD